MLSPSPLGIVLSLQRFHGESFSSILEYSIDNTNSGKMSKRLTIIADDLTGAMDSSGYLAGLGLSVVVFLDKYIRTTAAVSVISTDSRKDTPSVAAEKIKRMAKGLRGQIVFKKVDSTLRGNIDTELTALMEILSYEKAVLAPAFPAVGRTVVNGVLLVRGKPVAETNFARDLVTPVRESSIPLLLKSTGCTVGTVTLETVAKGAWALSREYTSRSERILVCDTAEQSHLKTIAAASSLAGSRMLLAGSGGLARELHLLIDGSAAKKSLKPEANKPGPTLIVIGSRHPVTARQIKKAEKESQLPFLQLRIEELDNASRKPSERNSIVKSALHHLEKGQSVAITSSFSRLMSAFEQEIVDELAEIAVLILDAGKTKGLFLSGGDTATAVCRALEASKIRVYGEIIPGMPAGELFAGRKRLRLVTKAGAFGDETAIVESMPFLERGEL